MYKRQFLGNALQGNAGRKAGEFQEVAKADELEDDSLFEVKFQKRVGLALQVLLTITERMCLILDMVTCSGMHCWNKINTLNPELYHLHIGQD